MVMVPPPKKVFSDFLAGLPTGNVPTPSELPAPDDLVSRAIQSLARGSTKVAKGVQEAGTAQREAWKKFLANPTAENSVDIAGDLIAPMTGTLKYIPEFMQAKTPVNFAAEKQALGEFLRNRLVKGGRHPLEGIKQRIDFQHSSNKLFPDPVISPDVAGAGAGDQWQGQGFYISEEPKVGSFYRNITGRDLPGGYADAQGRTVDLDRLDEVIAKAAEVLPESSPRKESLEELSRLFRDAAKPKLPASSLSSIQTGMDADRRAIEFYIKSLKNKNLGERWQREQARFELRDFLDYLASARRLFNSNSIRGTLAELPPQRAEATYSGNFYANPDELFDLQLPINQQPSSEKLLGALNQFNYGLNLEPMGDYLAAAQRGVGDPRAAYDINEGLVRHGKDINSGVTQGPQLPAFMWMNLPVELRSALFDLEPGQHLSQRLDPWKVMEALRDKGIVGNKYLTRFAAEGLVPPSHNYVVTDPSRVRLNDVWSMLGMLGGGAAATQTIKEKKNDPKRSKPRGG